MVVFTGLVYLRPTPNTAEVRGTGITPPPLLTKAALDRMMRMGRSNRLGTADDIASMVTFLLSDDGSWVTGQVIAVDGGVTMRP